MSTHKVLIQDIGKLEDDLLLKIDKLEDDLLLEINKLEDDILLTINKLEDDLLFAVEEFTRNYDREVLIKSLNKHVGAKGVVDFIEYIFNFQSIVDRISE